MSADAGVYIVASGVLGGALGFFCCALCSAKQIKYQIRKSYWEGYGACNRAHAEPRNSLEGYFGKLAEMVSEQFPSSPPTLEEAGEVLQAAIRANNASAAAAGMESRHSVMTPPKIHLTGGGTP